MGHEGVGVCEAVGPGVSTVKVGQTCILHWRKGAGSESPSPTWKMYNGGYAEPDYSAGQVTTFSQYSVVSENRVTAIPSDVPIELACLLGCGLSTGLGTIEHEAKLLMGESVLIIGCGGLGLNLILAAKLRQAGRIVAMDVFPEKGVSAMQMGADFFVDSSIKNLNISNPFICSATFQDYPQGEFDVVIDTSGDAEVIAGGISKLAPSGRFIMVGQPKPRENVMLTNARHLFDGTGKTIMATQGGRFCPNLDIPRWINAYRAGRFSVEGIVTHRFPLNEINSALDLVRQGQAGRVLIECQDDAR